jgi:hypothetical protein
MIDYNITEHAYFEMQRRGISEQIVRKVLEQPGQVQEARPGRRIYQSKIQFGEEAETYLVRVFIDTDRDPFEVVTVYRTSKIEKYWR